MMTMSLFDIFLRFVPVPMLMLTMLFSCSQQRVDNVDVADAPSYGLSIHEFSPKSKAALAYAKIASEVM